MFGLTQAQGDQYSHQKQQLELFLGQSDYPKALAIGLDLVTSTTKSSVTSDPRISESMILLGKAYTAAGQYADAEIWLRRALTHSKTYLEESAPANALIYRALAANAMRSGNFQLAPDFFDLGIEVLSKSGPEHRLEYAEALSERGGLHYFNENWDGAEQDYKEAMNVQEEVLGFQSPELARSLNNIGGVYMRQGYFARAKAVYQHALNMQKITLGLESPEATTTMINLAVYHDQMAEFKEAESYLKQALELRTKIHGPGHPLTGAVIDNMITMYLSMDQVDKAKELLKELREVRTTSFGGDHPLVADVLDKQASFAIARKLGDEAEIYLLEALSIREAHYGERHDLVAANLYNLGKLQNINGKPEAARLTLTRALDIYEFQPTGNEEALCGILAELVATDLSQGQSDLADQHLSLMLKIKEATYGIDHPELIPVLMELLKLYELEKQVEKAESIRARLYSYK